MFEMTVFSCMFSLRPSSFSLMLLIMSPVSPGSLPKQHNCSFSPCFNSYPSLPCLSYDKYLTWNCSAKLVFFVFIARYRRFWLFLKVTLKIERWLIACDLLLIFKKKRITILWPTDCLARIGWTLHYTWLPF